MDIKYIGFLGILGCFVLIPGLRMFWRARTLVRQQKVWRTLQDEIGILTLADIGGLPEPTHYVLNCVLTSRPGVGKPQAIPAALEHLAATVDAPLRALRSLSYFAVLFGLLATVAVLAYTFWGTKDISGIKPELLGHVYSFNAVAILLAAILYITHVGMRWRGDKLLLTASQTLGQLQAEIPENIDPHLVAALEAVGRNFTQWGEEIYARHRQDAQALVQEMKGLGTAIEGMVENMVTARRTEEEGIIPLLRTQDEKIELLSQRLDARFSELAEPIQKTLPLIEQWQRRLEELGNLLQTMMEADLPGNTRGLTSATEQLVAVVSELPQKVQTHFQGIKKVIATGLQDAVKEGWRQTVAPVFVDLSERLSLLLEAHQALIGAVNRLPEAVANHLTDSMITGWQKNVQPALNKMEEIIAQLLRAQQSLEWAINQMAKDIPHHVATGTQPLVQVINELSGNLQDLPAQLNVMRELPQTLVDAVGDALKNTGDVIATNWSAKLQELWESEVAPKTAEWSETLREILKEQQKQNYTLDTLEGRFDVKIESWGKKVAEQVTQGLREALAARGDGYLRDIADSLQELEKTWEQMSKEIAGSLLSKEKISWWPWR